MSETVQEFFTTLPERADTSKTTCNTYTLSVQE